MKTNLKSEVTPPECEASSDKMRAALHLTPDTPYLIRHSVIVILLALLFLTSVRAPAQEDTVTLGATEFQRLVYSAHLSTQMTEKPELEACLQALLELHRRNPNANPTALADLSRQALQHYRANAPAYVRTNGSRDEIFAAYLGALRQVPARTNFIPANLQLLNGFMLQPEDYANASPAELIHSGNQRLLASSGESAKRQALGETCMVRAQGNPAFATAVDTLLWPEAPISVHDTPAAIIGNTNSALHDNFTMQTLLALSAASGNGSLTISSNHVKSLFGKEMEVLWEVVHTNRALIMEFNQSEPNLLAYLTNQPARDLWESRLAAARQTRNIASSTAAILVQSRLTAAPNSSFEVPEWVGPVADTAGGLAKLLMKGDPSALISSMGGLIGLFDDSESPDEQIVREIGNIQTLMGDLSTNMNYRFDRVDQSLTTIFETLNEEFGKIEISLGQIAVLNGNVDDIRANLVDVQTDLHCLERHLLAYVNQLYGRGLNLDFNKYLGYEATYGDPMAQLDYNNTEAHFYTHARNNSVDGLSAPYQDRNYTAQGLLSELTESGGGATNRLDQNLSYIKKYLNDVLGQPTAGTLGDLANPRDWFVGAYSYAQLALENPRYFRQVNPTNRLDQIATRGRELTNFFRSLTFSGPNLNSPLYDALKNHYASNLISFNTQLSAQEGTFSTNYNFAVGTWRRWHQAAPRVAAMATELVSVPDTWSSPSTGQSFTAPTGLTNLVAIASGFDNDIALKADGTVVAWGDNRYGQTNVPSGLSNVVAVSAGSGHYLALKEDGTVIGWGINNYGQATGVPNGAPGEVAILGHLLTNVVAIAVGDALSLALTVDGTVIQWGYVSDPVPVNLSNVVAISANSFPVALKSDGTPVGWSYHPPALSSLVGIAAGSEAFLALNADGTVFAEGPDVEPPPSGLSNVVAIATGREFGRNHALALKTDGTVVGWGDDTYGQISIPASVSNVVAIAAGYKRSLFLRAIPLNGPAPSDSLSFVPGQIPRRVAVLLQDCNQNTIDELGRVGALRSAALGLSGPKALLTAVLELGLPYTLERDDVLHGFLYGSESLADLETARIFLGTQNTALQASLSAPFPTLTEVAVLRYQRFAERLTARLDDLQASGQPEFPRLVGHTLHLLNLLRDAWTQPANSPPPALELWSENGSPRLLLYGEPYTRYTLQYRDSLEVPGWNTTTVTDWRNEKIISPPVSTGPQRFYRSLLPTQ